jgi:cation transport ATPase
MEAIEEMEIIEEIVEEAQLPLEEEESQQEQTQQEQTPQEQIPQEPVPQEQEQTQQEQEKEKPQKIEPQRPDQSIDSTGFVHGLSVGLGLGCLCTFIVLWVALFFTPQLPQGIRYEQLLSVFIFPLLYLLAVGLITLTAGIVKQYFARKPQ